MARAAKMETTKTPGVFKRGRRYTITYRDAEGKQRKESAPTYKEACALRVTRLHEVSRGESSLGRQTTLGDLVEDWYRDFSSAAYGVRERTVRDYRSQMTRYVLPLLGSKTKVTEIRPIKIRRLISALLQGDDDRKALQAATVKRVLVPLRKALDLAVEEGLIAANPVASVKVPVGRGVERCEKVKALSREDLKALLSAVDSEHRLFMDTVAATGARWSEAVAWKKKDLDRSNRCLRIERSLQQGEIASPKTENSRRRVKLSNSLFDRLERRLRKLDDDDFIFQRESGKPLDYPFCRREVLLPAAEKSGVEVGGFHTLRHTAASILFDSGSNIKEVQHFLGHSNPGFTLDTYIHLIDERRSPIIDLKTELDQISKE